MCPDVRKYHKYKLNLTLNLYIQIGSLRMLPEVVTVKRVLNIRYLHVMYCVRASLNTGNAIVYLSLLTHYYFIHQCLVKFRS